MHPYVYTTAALFIVAKTWKPLTGEWIKKTQQTYAMEQNSAIKEDEMLPFAVTQMDLEGIMLSEISQRKQNTI